MTDSMFSGEEMTCIKCGWKMNSSPNFESQWTAMIADGKRIDVCPHCWGIPRHRWPKQVRELWDKDHPTGDKK